LCSGPRAPRWKRRYQSPPAAPVSAEVNASYAGARRRSTGRWGTFDLAVSFCSRRQADPSSDDFIFRNSGDARQIEIGWWPGDRDYDRPAFFAFAYRPPAGAAVRIPCRRDSARLTSSRCHAMLEPEFGEIVVDREDIGLAEDPRAFALEFAHSAFRHASCCEWNPILAASAEGSPPPVGCSQRWTAVAPSAAPVG
jgi:hypothetical protein